MTKSHYHSAKFLLSVAKLTQLPPDQGYEVAIVGRSNAGKSSVINQLTQNNSLARVSKTPGRTQLINLFTLDDERRLADLPGYGYAKVPPAMKIQWQKLLDSYLRSRECLRGLILVMDIRHPMREFDQLMLAWCQQSDLPVHILLNKSDKLSQSEISKTLQATKKAIAEFDSQMTVQTFSASKGRGIAGLKECLDQWFEF